MQSASESVEQFVSELQTLAKDYEFKEIEEMIRNRIVIGVYAEKISKGRNYLMKVQRSL